MKHLEQADWNVVKFETVAIREFMKNFLQRLLIFTVAPFLFIWMNRVYRKNQDLVEALESQVKNLLQIDLECACDFLALAKSGISESAAIDIACNISDELERHEDVWLENPTGSRSLDRDSELWMELISGEVPGTDLEALKHSAEYMYVVAFGALSGGILGFRKTQTKSKRTITIGGYGRKLNNRELLKEMLGDGDQGTTGDTEPALAESKKR